MLEAKQDTSANVKSGRRIRLMRPLLLRSKRYGCCMDLCFYVGCDGWGEGYISTFGGLLRCTFMNANGLRINGKSAVMNCWERASR